MTFSSIAPSQPPARLSDEFALYDAVGLGELVQRGEVHPRELVQAAILRIERLNPILNAVVTPMYEEALHQAERLAANAGSLLHGVPFLLKDLFAPYAGVRMTCGSRYYRNYVPTEDNELVARYRRAGLLCVGRTNTPEFGLLPVTEPDLFGPTENPWRPGFTTGGSSGGSAAAVASGLVPVAHGSDGGGSLRIPASCCGVVGFKPTRARVPVGPDDSEYWLGFATGHAITRSVRDTAAMLDVSAGPEPTAQYWAPPAPASFLQDLQQPLRRLKIALCTQPLLPSKVHSHCVQAAQSAARLCQELGHEVVEDAPDIDAQAFALSFFMLLCGATASGLDLSEQVVGKRLERKDFETTTWLMAMLGRQFRASDMFNALHTVHAEARKVHRFMTRYDALLTPTLGWPPMRHGKLRPRGPEATVHEWIATLNLGSALKLPRVVEITVNRVFNFIPFTPVFNVTGQPSISLPLYWDQQNLPIGVMFSGRLGDDSTILRLSKELEEARPWKDRRPPINAFHPGG